MVERSALDVAAHYARDLEADRLDEPVGVVEYLRTVEIVTRVLPPAPATVADIGGGPGRYALWLADRGYRVVHRDLVPLHVERLQAARHPRVDTAVADARGLDLPDAAADAVLLLGPLYHLYERDERVRALREAARIARPGAPVLVSAISRWAPRLHGYLAERLYERIPTMADVVARVEADGRLVPFENGAFGAYCHTPAELRAEVSAAGLVVEDLVNVEGLAFALRDLGERMADDAARSVVLECARATERVPELLGLGPHLVVTGRRA
jgi:SAM-dependent methyltransferase